MHESLVKESDSSSSAGWLLLDRSHILHPEFDVAPGIGADMVLALRHERVNGLWTLERLGTAYEPHGDHRVNSSLSSATTLAARPTPPALL